MVGKVEKLIKGKLTKGKLHFSLLDPDPRKLTPKNAASIAEKLEEWESDAILVGGSNNFETSNVDEIIRAMKRVCSLPMILYPGNPKGVSRFADAILFMSLVNSKNPYWVTGAQAESILGIKKAGLEMIPMAYVIVEPGMTVGKVGEADLIKKGENERAAGYAAVAEGFGFRFVYFEAGSGATSPVPIDMIKAVRKEISIPLIVGGGIRKPESARERLEAGADIIVTGTIIEDDINKLKPIIEEIKKF